ncbi:Crp/Fnr family transcriptional regulator [Fulvivirga sp.]|jgi:CRP-like cAMP-binding protein|uniref:Crp/Fnr family transcriptional regulator n=1 Tax=Fulvivirga sp. TaxID=1931237 RepID=UPI0032EA9A0C
MIDKLKQHITNRLGKSPENLDLVLPHFEESITKRGEIILRMGEVCKYVYFIVEGCIQVYVIDKNGNESTREFYLENQWVTDIFGFQNQTPSSEFIKSVEPCKLLRIYHDKFQFLSQEVPQFAAIYKQILEVSYNNTIYRVNTLTAMDALERMKWLIDNKPKIMSRLSSKLIASYLGISPETMTRLKGKL